MRRDLPRLCFTPNFAWGVSELRIAVKGGGGGGRHLAVLTQAARCPHDEVHISFIFPGKCFPLKMLERARLGLAGRSLERGARPGNRTGSTMAPCDKVKGFLNPRNSWHKARSYRTSREIRLVSTEASHRQQSQCPGTQGGRVRRDAPRPRRHLGRDTATLAARKARRGGAGRGRLALMTEIRVRRSGAFKSH